jgi:hypothetical protein
MPKVPEDYQPKGERVRVRAKETEYIKKVAEQYDETFLDALYRIVNYHRDLHLGRLAEIVETRKKVDVLAKKVEPSPKKSTDNDFEVDVDLDLFS